MKIFVFLIIACVSKTLHKEIYTLVVRNILLIRTKTLIQNKALDAAKEKQ
jgi:hypothetical protein